MVKLVVMGVEGKRKRERGDRWADAWGGMAMPMDYDYDVGMLEHGVKGVNRELGRSLLAWIGFFFGCSLRRLARLRAAAQIQLGGGIVLLC